MKTNNFLKKALSTGVICLSTLATVNGQAVNCQDVAIDTKKEPVSVLSVITEKDYPNFLNITGLKKYSNIKYNGSPVNFNSDNRYWLRSNGNSASLDAVYGRDGNLIRATYIKKNSTLPKAIYHQLASDAFKGWVMVGNKTIVRDFDAMRTEYEVEIQKGDMKQTLVFDNSSNRIMRLAKN